MLRCSRCGRTYPERFMLKCRCGGTLRVERKYRVFHPLDFLDLRRYLKYLPVNSVPAPVPAITPTVRRNIMGLEAFFKLDYLQPSGSFKDRGTWVTVSKLVDEGVNEVVLDSSGNASVSLALYGLSLGINVHVFVSESISRGKLFLLKRLKADVHVVKGDRMRVHEEAIEFSENGGGTYVSHWLNPYFIEGTKTVAYEVYEQVGVPDYIIVPVGSGSLFLGIWKGFNELKKMGAVERIPRMVAVQASGYESLCERSSEKNRIAEGIAIPKPPRLEEIRDALRKSKGICISVNEQETFRGLEKLEKLGFIVEPTSAVILPALERIINGGHVNKGETVVAILTGSGMKLMAGG